MEQDSTKNCKLCCFGENWSCSQIQVVCVKIVIHKINIQSRVKNITPSFSLAYEKWINRLVKLIKKLIKKYN